MNINYTKRKIIPSRTTPLLEKRSEPCGQKPEKYKLLLHSIATSLGLGEKESQELVEYVCLIGKKNYTYQKENYTLKIWLSKILVHNCIFRISSSMFSQNANTANSFQTANHHFMASPFSKIPISFGTAYVLFHSIGFNESEVAQILNISLMQVKERLAKAMIIIKNQQEEFSIRF
jgi:hypothetical protein